MQKIFLFLLVSLALPCMAGKGEFIPEIDSIVRSKQISNFTWKIMGLCNSASQICIYMDTITGSIIQLRRLDKEKFSIRDVDKPISTNTLQEGAFLTSKYRKKKIKLIEENLFILTYEAKRGKIVIEVNPDNYRIKNISFRK